jgi:hypothetical protein
MAKVDSIIVDVLESGETMINYLIGGYAKNKMDFSDSLDCRGINFYYYC